MNQLHIKNTINPEVTWTRLNPALYSKHSKTSRVTLAECLRVSLFYDDVVMMARGGRAEAEEFTSNHC